MRQRCGAMVGNGAETLRAAQSGFQSVAQTLIILLRAALVAATLAAAFGLLPWPQLALFFGGQAGPQACMWLQIGLMAIVGLTVLFLPANTRMTRLKRSHRSFATGMQDVSHAYWQAHAADRAGVFALSGECDTMRARMEHLRDHPDFQHL